MDILSVVTRVPILVFGVERHDDDFADRINYKYTVAVLVIFAIIVTNRQFGTKQIHCWIPAYFTRNYEEYINDICWVSNTYYISLDQKLPEAEQIRKSFELKYYQWVPFILLSQAFFFYIPHIAWRALSRRSGIDVRDIVEAASNYKSVDKYENRKKYMDYMLTAVDQYVDDPRRRKETRRSLLIKRLLSAISCCSGKFLGNYLMVLYLFIKLAFIANCISQLFVLNLLLGHEFHKFGFELLDKIINGKGWDTGSRIFPKISMCDFRIREVGNPKVSHRYTVQCVLPINLFNQQIFTFIWFWYIIVLFVNLYSLCVWTYRFLPSKRLRYITRRIEIMRQALMWKNKNPLNFDQMPDLELHQFEKEIINQFVHDYLESDGLFILRVLSSNTSDFVCTELIQELWRYFREQKKFDRTMDEDEDLNDDESVDSSKRRIDFDDKHIEYSNIQQTKQTNKNKTRGGTTSHHLAPDMQKNRSNYDDKDNDINQEDDLNDDDNDQNYNEDDDTYHSDVTRTSTQNYLKFKRNTIAGPHQHVSSARQTRMTGAPIYNRTGQESNKSSSILTNKKSKNKPLAVISEQIVSMYNKTKSKVESPQTEQQQQQSSRPKFTRALSHDPKSLTSVNTYLVTQPAVPQQQQQQYQSERKLKRPTNLGKKLDNSVIASEQEATSSPTITPQPPPLPTQQPPQMSSTLTTSTPNNSPTLNLPNLETQESKTEETLIEDDNSNTSNNSNNNNNNSKLNSTSEQSKLKSKYFETET